MTPADRSRLWLWLAFCALAAFCLFFLTRPFLDAGDAGAKAVWSAQC